MNLARCLKSQKGSVVVEASIIVPVVILSIVGIIYLAVLLYQLAYIQCIADRSAEQGALSWNSVERDLDSGKPIRNDLSKSGLYWRLVDRNKHNKETRLLNHLDMESEKFDIFSVRNRNSGVKSEDFVVYKKLIVQMDDAYALSAGRYLKQFGIGENYVIRTESEAVVLDPAEFIRNTDFILDMEIELEEKNPGVKRLGDKTREVIGDIRDKIESFFR